MTLLAFHGDPNVKEFYLNRVRAHEAADEIIHGKYWENGRGCAVGCSVHSGSHKAYEIELGIPRMLARLEDRLFEGMANGNSKQFPAQFLTAAPVGADLTRVGWQFLYWLLTEELASRDDPRVAKEIKACADVLIPLTKGEPVDRNAAGLARRAAWEARSRLGWPAAAADDAAYAADDAADAAAAAAAAAYAYADDAAAAAAAAAYAADDAADAAAAADAAYADAVRQGAHERMAKKLLELMAAAPIPVIQPYFARQVA